MLRRHERIIADGLYLFPTLSNRTIADQIKTLQSKTHLNQPNPYHKQKEQENLRIRDSRSSEKRQNAIGGMAYARKRTLVENCKEKHEEGITNSIRPTKKKRKKNLALRTPKTPGVCVICEH